VIGYVLHNLALCAVPAALGLLALALRSRWSPRAITAATWSRGPNPGVNLSQALNVCIIQVIVAVGPPLGGLLLTIYVKTDWGISLFFLTPLALVAIPVLRVPAVALFNIVAIWLVITLAVYAASTWIAVREMEFKPNSASAYGARSELARELTQLWRARFGTKWAVAMGYMEMAQPFAFYSPDHPAPLTPWEPWTSGLTSLEEAKKLGFIGVCDTTDWRLPRCEEWFVKNFPDAERMVMTTQRFYRGHPGPSIAWKVYVVPPAK
jgi:hypothetical protein